MQFFQSLAVYIGTHPSLAILIVFLISAGEAIFVLGLFVPSTIVLVAAGTLIGTGQLSFWPIFIASSLGAFAGDQLSYWIGHIWKESIRAVWPFSKYTGLLDQGEAFFGTHGAKSIFIGRFIPGIKSVVPGVAGMMRMDVVRFTTINFISSFVWAGAHIIPAMAVGRGLQVTHIANPHLAILVILFVTLAITAWYLTKLIIGFGLPYLERIRVSLIERLSRQETRISGVLIRLLKNEQNILVEFSYIGVAILALSGVLTLAVALAFEPDLAASDQAISTFIQSLRNAPADSFMTLATMLGDTVVVGTLACIMVIALLLTRQWQLSAICTAAFLSAAVFVPFAKTLLQRTRPIPLYSGAESFSFPSAHAAYSMVIYGVIAVLCARSLSARWRMAIYAATAFLVAMIALSRMYLQAHWPSDVLAGLLFGTGVVCVFAFVIHDRPLAVPVGKMAAMLGLVLAIVYPVHVRSSFDTAKINYAKQPQIRTMTHTDWLSGGWKTLPEARALLDGDVGEQLSLQSDLPADDLVKIFVMNGWTRSNHGWVDGIYFSVIPTRQPFENLASLPNTNLGKSASLTLTKQDLSDPNSRLVLRFWPTDVMIDKPSKSSSLLVGSFTTEAMDEFAFGLSTVEQVCSANQILTARSLTNLPASAKIIDLGSKTTLITQDYPLQSADQGTRKRMPL